jgi:GNAT superfamily N-acetyltransferase
MWSVTPKHLLLECDRHLLVKHFIALSTEDRRLRFGLAVGDSFIEHYVQQALDDNTSEIFVIIIQDQIAAVCHVAVSGTEGELGVSVSAEYRGQGMASVLFDRAVGYLRTHGADTVYIHCLRENTVMQSIARKHQMQVYTEYNETDARLSIPKPTAATIYEESRQTRVAVFDMLMRHNIRIFKKILGVE